VTDDLDTLLAANPPATETAVSVVRSDRRCRRHQWVERGTLHVIDGHATDITSDGWYCLRCRVERDPVRSRRGKSASRRGKDYERTLAQRLGGVKVGHHGGPEDVRAGMFSVQSKVKKAFPEWQWDELVKLPRTGGRIPLLVVAKAGAPKHAIVVLSLDDWVDLHGVTIEEVTP